MRIVIVSGFNKQIEDLGQISSQNQRAYAQRHAYDYRCYTKGFHPSKLPQWSKLLFIRELLRQKNPVQEKVDLAQSYAWDWVMWIDADAVFTNFSMRLETFIESADRGEEIIIGEDAWGINTGLWFIKNSEWARDFLVDLWISDPEPYAMQRQRPPVWIEQPRYLVEQSTLWHLVNLRNEVSRLKLIHYSKLGGYLAEYDHDNYTPRDQAMRPPSANAPIERNSWQPGDFALHLAGVPTQRKRELLINALQSVSHLTA